MFSKHDNDGLDRRKWVWSMDAILDYSTNQILRTANHVLAENRASVHH